MRLRHFGSVIGTDFRRCEMVANWRTAEWRAEKEALCAGTGVRGQRLRAST
jgi:hypothetical protein